MPPLIHIFLKELLLEDILNGCTGSSILMGGGVRQERAQHLPGESGEDRRGRRADWQGGGQPLQGRLQDVPVVQARGAVRAVRKGAEGKPRIRAVGEIAGFGGLRAADAAELRALVEAELAFRAGLQAAEADGAEIFDHPEGKFWSIVCAGSTTRVKWGRAGEEGQLSEKSHADEEAAGKFVEKMVRRGGRRPRSFDVH